MPPFLSNFYMWFFFLSYTPLISVVYRIKGRNRPVTSISSNPLCIDYIYSAARQWLIRKIWIVPSPTYSFLLASLLLILFNYILRFKYSSYHIRAQKASSLHTIFDHSSHYLLWIYMRDDTLSGSFKHFHLPTF